MPMLDGFFIFLQMVGFEIIVEGSPRDFDWLAEQLKFCRLVPDLNLRGNLTVQVDCGTMV